jgi:hypothetical protein
MSLNHLRKNRMDTISGINPASVPRALFASGKASTEAMMHSSQIWAAGCKTLGEIMMETAKGHFNQTASVWQAMGQVKTMQEIVDLQIDYLRNSTEHSVASAKKLVNTTNQLTREAMSPIVSQLASVSPVTGVVD